MRLFGEFLQWGPTTISANHRFLRGPLGTSRGPALSLASVRNWLSALFDTTVDLEITMTHPGFHAKSASRSTWFACTPWLASLTKRVRRYLGARCQPRSVIRSEFFQELEDRQLLSTATITKQILNIVLDQSNQRLSVYSDTSAMRFALSTAARIPGRR